MSIFSPSSRLNRDSFSSLSSHPLSRQLSFGIERQANLPSVDSFAKSLQTPALRFGFQDAAHKPREGGYILSPVNADSQPELTKLSSSILNVPEVLPKNILGQPVYALKKDGFFPDNSVTDELKETLKTIEGEHALYLQRVRPQLESGEVVEGFAIKPSRLTSQTTKLLKRQKYHISRFYDLAIPEYTSPTQRQTMNKTQQFVMQLQDQYGKSVNVFRQNNFGGETINTLSDKSLEVYRTIVAMTAPLIFNMGFADGIPHAGQVSRLAANQMRRFYREYPANMIEHNDSITSDKISYDAAMAKWRSEGADPEIEPKRHTTERQMLQAAIVGWLHDCKLDGLKSKENLASHPLVSSAVAWSVAMHVLQDDNVEKLLATNLGLTTPEERADFIQEIVEAISLNNDSYFVLNYAILGAKAVKDQPGRGIIGLMEKANEKMSPSDPHYYSAEAMEHLKKWAEQRFWAPSKSKSTDPSKSLDPEAGRSMPQTLKAYCADPENHVPEGVETKIENALNTLTIKTGLFDRKGQPVCVPVKYLFSHHEDVSPSAHLLALCLEFADNLLLSPHKTVAVNSGSPINKMTIYLDSLQKNFESLPQDVNEFQQPYRRAIMLSMLKASDEYRQEQDKRRFYYSKSRVGVSAESLYNPFIQKVNERHTAPVIGRRVEPSYDLVNEDNRELKETLLNPETWGRQWSEFDNDKVKDKSYDKAFKSMIALFEKNHASMSAAYADVAMKNKDEERFLFEMPNSN